ncbi:hypothetical protein ACP4OV_018639 [Aristida adscensionis]
METTTTSHGDLSSTANHSFSGDDGAAASEESGWTSYIDYFMETQRRQKEASSDDNGPRRSTSEYDGDQRVGGGEGSSIASSFAGAPRVPEASRRLKKVGRRKKVLHDDSLEDTATSPISSPKLIELRGSDANHQRKEDAYECDEISHPKNTNTTADDGLGCGKHINNGANTSTDMANNDDGVYDNNELRKKGLFLVPVSVFRLA